MYIDNNGGKFEGTIIALLENNMTTKVLISGNGMSIKERAKRIAQRTNCKHRTEDGNCSKTVFPVLKLTMSIVLNQTIKSTKKARKKHEEEKYFVTCCNVCVDD